MTEGKTPQERYDNLMKIVDDRVKKHRQQTVWVFVVILGVVLALFMCLETILS